MFLKFKQSPLVGGNILIKALPLIAFSVCLTGCEQSAQQRADFAAVQLAPVSPAIHDKMEHGDYLSVSDIADLGRAHINDAIIIRYLRDHDFYYRLNSEDVAFLLKSGVSHSVIDFMMRFRDFGYYSPGPDPYYYGYPFFEVDAFYGGYHHHHWR
jgi:hypothetical protein